MALGRERIVPVYIEDEMKSSYIDYAMSVIVSRALPDARDGLKPVQRRILVAMRDLGVMHDKPHRKSAKITGDVTGNYHPHGTVAVYEAMVRMAQDFSVRYPLIDGQGNFGSIDGDSPAAERYTEARLSALAGEMLKDIEKETVNFKPNYDESREEPVVLPALLPNLLLNGCAGIAVGMATNVPPHNLGEIVDAIVKVVDDPDVPPEELLKVVKGPDFPTGAVIYGRSGIRDCYLTGKGLIKVRAKASIETQENGKESIIIVEIPYQVNKSSLLEKIAGLVKEGRIEGVSDLRDESDRDGMRIVIDLKKDAQARVILNQLYHHTQLETTFGASMLAIVNERPKVLTLKDAIEQYIEHRKEIIERRTKYDLAEAEKRAHILEGLRIALNNIDAIIALIKKAKDTETAKIELMAKFKLSDIQAQSILDMRLARLTGLERKKIEDEYLELIKLIAQLKGILESARKIREIVRTEALGLKEKYGDERRTEIVSEGVEFEVEDLIAEEEMVVTISRAGYIKRLPVTTYRKQARGGKGVTGASIKEEDLIEHLFITSTHSFLLFFTTRGKCYWLKVHEIPQAGRIAKGKPIVNIIETEKNERVTAVVPVKEFDDQHHLIMATRSGIIKKTILSAYGNPRKAGINAINLDEGDELIDAQLTDGSQDIVLAKKQGKAVRFNERDVRPMGRTAHGVKGATLEGKDEVVGMVSVKRDGTLLVVTENGYGKRSPLDDYRVTRRGGKGIITVKNTPRNGAIVALLEVVDDDELVIITIKGQIIRLPVKGVSVMGRNTQGVRLITLDEGDKVAGVARVHAAE